MVDGTAAHALDFDDVDDALIAHPSAVLVPALLAGGQAPDVSGATLLDAFAVGIVAGRAVAAGLGIAEHYGRGWHSTGTVGAVAAT
ncbi:MmgE/PrpD family protein, partial [Pseudonocardia pini]|uniref:MmgE/PrpD family protein n=1 Tax=Pseudonocardia pini TaxID=2758030 RepID=UPI0015F09686